MPKAIESSLSPIIHWSKLECLAFLGAAAAAERRALIPCSTRECEQIANVLFNASPFITHFVKSKGATYTSNTQYHMCIGCIDYCVHKQWATSANQLVFWIYILDSISVFNEQMIKLKLTYVSKTQPSPDKIFAKTNRITRITIYSFMIFIGMWMSLKCGHYLSTFDSGTNGLQIEYLPRWNDMSSRMANFWVYFWGSHRFALVISK